MRVLLTQIGSPLGYYVHNIQNLSIGSNIDHETLWEAVQQHNIVFIAHDPKSHLKHLGVHDYEYLHAEPPVIASTSSYSHWDICASSASTFIKSLFSHVMSHMYNSVPSLSSSDVLMQHIPDIELCHLEHLDADLHSFARVIFDDVLNLLDKLFLPCNI